MATYIVTVRSGGNVYKLRTTRLSKMIVTTLAALSISVVGVAPANSAAPVELTGSAWYPGYGADQSSQSFINAYRMYLLGEEAGSYSHLLSWSNSGGDVGLCQNGSGVGSIADAGAGVETNCDLTTLRTEDRYLEAMLVLPPCSETGVDENLCIESVSIYESGTTASQATLIEQTPGPIVAAQTDIGLRAGSTMSIWESSWNHAGGTGRYLVNAVVTANAFRYDGEETLSYEGLRITVTPVEEIDDVDLGEVTLSVSGPMFVEENKFADKCGYTSGVPGTSGKCGRNHDFAANTRVSVSVRVPSTVGGFFKGRMESPDITVAARDGHEGTQIITASGESASAPRVLGSLTYCVMPGDADVDPTKDCEGTTPETNGGTINPDIAGLPTDMATRAGFEAGFSSGTLYKDTDSDALTFINWAKVQNSDTATAVQTLWSFSTMGMGSQDQCLMDTTIMHGIVTTNAMAYSDSPPTMDESGNLNYVVAGMHYLPGGTEEVSGSYHLFLNKNTADCLYGSLGDNPTATVSIVDDSAQEKQATVAFSVDSDWLKLSATGFAFSQNTISVGLTPTVVESPPAPSAPPVIPIVNVAPQPVTPPTIPAGTTGAVLIGGQSANVTIAPSSTKGSLEIKGTDWSLDISPSTARDALNANGELVLNPQLTPDISGAGFQANSKASAYLIPSSATQVAALGISQGGLRAMTTGTIDLGEIPVSATGTFTANLDLSSASPGSYVLQINGAAPDGKIRSISVKANVPDTALKGWTKKISDNQVKVYVKNVVGAGKVQIFVNGEELAWINAGDETDRKLRFAQGFNYLVRTVILEPGKNRIEIRLDGERIRFNTYGLE